MYQLLDAGKFYIRNENEHRVILAREPEVDAAHTLACGLDLHAKTHHRDTHG